MNKLNILFIIGIIIFIIIVCYSGKQIYNTINSFQEITENRINTLQNSLNEDLK